ncbi:hypothetical protein ACQEVS_10055 [Streptomyces sp. CA-181903]|uniref:hypothetical protein n=1 Tax=Streptomyces sp. CA-181903 TaxID=3240055 RepID=UPI003D93EF04
MSETGPAGARATSREIEMVKLMLRIAADIDRLDDLSDGQPWDVQASNKLVAQRDSLRAQARQAAWFRRCPVLAKIVAEAEGG